MKKREEISKTVRLNINIAKDLKERFMAVAKENDTDSNKLVRQWIKEYLAKNSQTKIQFK